MTEQMRPSGIEWIGDIPQGWKTKKIKYFTKLVNGSTPDSGDFNFWDGPIKWITPADMENTGVISEGERTLTKSGYTSCGTTLLPKGSIVISSRAPIGKINITGDVLCTNQGCKSLVKNADNRYLYYLLLAGQDELVRLGRGTTFVELSTYDLANFGIIVPQESEQKVIANFLDNQCVKIDGIIADIEKQIETLQKYKKSLITETVTKGLDKSVPMKDSGIECIGNIPIYWSVKRVKYVIDSIKDGTHGTFDRVDTGEYLLSAKNVFDDGIRIGQNESEISVTDYKSIVANGYPQKSDVLLCCVGTVGRCCVYEFDKPYAFQRSVSFLRPLSSTDSFFLQFALQSNSTLIQEQLLINKSAQDGLYMGSVRELIIAIPNSIEEQKSISEFLKTKVAHIDELIVNKEQQLETIKQHKKSLIYEYVTGKKRVTEVN